MNIVVLGGGTAGWLTALTMQKHYPKNKITLIESEEVGILGAGEGSTPFIMNMLHMLDIPFSDIFRRCDATLKLGIEFANWNGDGQSYFHSFQGGGGGTPLEFAFCDMPMFQNLGPLYQIAEGGSVDDITFPTLLIKDAKVPYVAIPANPSASPPKDPLEQVQQVGAYSIHFNARKLAAYLSFIAQARGVERIEGKLKTISNDQDGNITHLLLINDKLIDVDYLFDCSGFARLVIGEHFKSKWESYNKHLPLDTAMPFFIPHDNKDIKPQTEAIALKYGWMWKIPVRDRYGCGYVFDSKYINEQQAKEEVEELLGHAIDPGKAFKFKAGAYDQPFVNNCMAVGLAQGFIEPLEATAITFLSISLLEFLKHDVLNANCQQLRDILNKENTERNQQVVEFLYLHYLTKRDDSEFWKDFRKNTEMVPKLKERLDKWNIAPPVYFLDNTFFEPPSWMQVTAGLGLQDQQPCERLIKNLNLGMHIDTRIRQMKSNQQRAVEECLTHDEFIDMLM